MQLGSGGIAEDVIRLDQLALAAGANQLGLQVLKHTAIPHDRFLIRLPLTSCTFD